MISYFIPLIAFWFARVTGVPQKFKFAFKRRVKPFDCPFCFSFWLALVHEICTGFDVDSLWYFPLCSLFAYIIVLIAGKLKLPLNV